MCDRRKHDSGFKDDNAQAQAKLQKWVDLK